MSSSLRRTWVDIVFMASMIGVLLAGMRGFSSYFPVALGLAVLYLLLTVLRLLSSKKVADKERV